MDYNKLLEYCRTDMEIKYIEARISEGSCGKAAVKLGKSRRTVEQSIKKIQAYAADKGYAPGHWDSGVAAGRTMGKVTIQRGADGEIQRSWERQLPDNIEKAITDFAEGLTENIKPCRPSLPPKFKKHTPDLMTAIFIGDAHVGLRAYGKETKHADFDTDIATKQLRDAIDYLVDKAEITETGVLVDVGDFMHANGQHNMTYAGTSVDVDSRYSMVLFKAGMAMRYMIDRMLTKFKKVVVVVAKGNHNTDAAPAIQVMLDFYYSRDKRVNVLKSDGFYHYIEYGNNLLGIHHGDKQKAESLAGSMARDMCQAWGRTTYRMWCLGHFHKENVKTLPGVKVKVFAALPPPDSWHASHGYAGDGEMEMLTFRKSGGLYSSHVYSIPQPHVEPDVKI